MAEYIEREALEVALNHRLNFLMAENGEYDHYTSGFDEAVTRVEDFPSADVSLVRHGRWKEMHYEGGILDGTNFDRCSICGYERVFDDPALKTVFKYCPNCGAKMDGGDG